MRWLEGCVMALLFLAATRIAIIVLWWQGYLQRAMASLQVMAWPCMIMGFLFAPCSTIAYAYAMNDCGGVISTGPGLAAMILGVSADALYAYKVYDQ